MQIIPQHQRTFLFAVFLAASGFLHHLYPSSPFLHSLIFSLTYACYAGLILSWMQSVYTRLLPSPSRNCMLISAMLMIFFLFIRNCKYRLVLSSVLMDRILWYAFYIPFLLIPAFFLIGCISFIHPALSLKSILSLLLFPLALVLCILTNDHHHLVFRPLPGIPFTSNTGTYAYAPLYALSLIWIVLSISSGVLYLLSATSRLKQWKKSLWPVFFIALIGLLHFGQNFLVSHHIRRFYELPETVIFCMIGVFEYCIRVRLVPSNEHYTVFFQEMQLPVAITDSGLQPAYTSAYPLKVSPDLFLSALQAPVSLSPDITLHADPISAGYAFWTEDKSTVHRLNRELEQANELLQEENALLQAEKDLEIERQHTQMKSQLYASAARQVYPTQKKIAALLEAITPEKDNFREVMAHIMVMNAYVKRRTNFVLQEAEKDTVTSNDLRLALEESARFLVYCQVQAFVDCTAAKSFSCSEAMQLFDSYEAVIESLLPRIQYLLIVLSDSGLRLAADIPCIPSLPDTPLPVHCERTDDSLQLSILLPGRCTA